MTRRRVGIAFAAIVLVALAAGYRQWYLPTRHAVDIGSGMLAKQLCSCIFVARREVDACRKDQLPSMDRIQFELLEEPPAVRAFVPLLGERLARYREGLGCTLQ